MSEYLSKAKSLASQGDRKLLTLGWFSNKYEEAAELYEKAANQFKLAKACARPRQPPPARVAPPALRRAAPCPARSRAPAHSERRHGRRV